MRVSGLKARHRMVRSKTLPSMNINIVLTFELECGDRKTSRRIEVEEVSPSMHLDGEPWRISQEDMRNAVLVLAYGTTNARPEKGSSEDNHVYWATDKLRKSLKVKIRRLLRTKAMNDRITKRDLRLERTNMIENLDRSMREIMKKYPSLRKQDVMDAVERAMKVEIVRQVMED